MAANDPSPPGAAPSDLQTERACFDGTLIAALAYGALLMLYIQLAQILLARPKRGRTFVAIMVYSIALFPLATMAIGGTLKSMEVAYIDNPNFPGGPIAFYRTFTADSPNAMSQISATLIPWFGDLLMLYRLMVVWNHQWRLLIFPGLTYISNIAISIPFLISKLRPQDPFWIPRSGTYATCFYSLSVAFNGSIMIMIGIRLYMMRKRLEVVMGEIHASFYTSTVTIFVESGAFFTLWATIYLIAHSRGSYVEQIFLLPYMHILGITRLLIVLRIAQDRAWSKDLVTATDRGIMDWQVSSTHSIPSRDTAAGSATSFQDKMQAEKMRQDSDDTM